MIYVCEHHDALLFLWREQDLRGIRLLHVDFHDDLRGLLVDRRRGRAYPIGSLARGEAPVDAGNFLAHAVIEGRVESIRWVHGIPGGRAWDAGIVRYESDLLAWRDRRRQRRQPVPERPLQFDELRIERWGGILTGERLSVDWDCFASTLQPAGEVDARVSDFVERLGSRVPPDTYLAFSPEYSRPGLDRFRALLATLRDRFGQPVHWLSPGLEQGRLQPRRVETDPAARWPMRWVLLLRRLGFY